MTQNISRVLKSGQKQKSNRHIRHFFQYLVNNKDPRCSKIGQNHDTITSMFQARVSYLLECFPFLGLLFESNSFIMGFSIHKTFFSCFNWFGYGIKNTEDREICQEAENKLQLHHTAAILTLFHLFSA